MSQGDDSDNNNSRNETPHRQTTVHRGYLRKEKYPITDTEDSTLQSRVLTLVQKFQLGRVRSTTPTGSAVEKIINNPRSTSEPSNRNKHTNNSTQHSGVKFERHANRNHGEHIVVSNIQRHVSHQENQYQNERPGYDAGILAINHNPVSGPNK